MWFSHAHRMAKVVLVFPILLLLVFGAVGLDRLLKTFSLSPTPSRQAARYAATQGPSDLAATPNRDQSIAAGASTSTGAVLPTRAASAAMDLAQPPILTTAAFFPPTVAITPTKTAPPPTRAPTATAMRTPTPTLKATVAPTSTPAILQPTGSPVDCNAYELRNYSSSGKKVSVDLFNLAAHDLGMISAIDITWRDGNLLNQVTLSASVLWTGSSPYPFGLVFPVGLRPAIAPSSYQRLYLDFQSPVQSEPDIVVTFANGCSTANLN